MKINLFFAIIISFTTISAAASAANNKVCEGNCFKNDLEIFVY